MKMISKLVLPIVFALLVVGCNQNSVIKDINDDAVISDTQKIEGQETNEIIEPTNNTENPNTVEVNEVKSIKILVNNITLEVALEDNSSAEVLYEKLKEGNVTIDAHDFSNFEKVGELGFELPRNDKQYTTKAGDVILYLGTRFVLYYDTNSWDFTKLGEVTNVPGSELKDILGDGNVTMILSIE